MKQGTQFRLTVRPSNIDVSLIRKMEFIFKQAKDKSAEKLKYAVYPGDVVKATEIEGAFWIPFTAEDTYKFVAGRPVYMDTRVWLSGMTDNPETNIVRLGMSPTLFDSWEDA